MTSRNESWIFLIFYPMDSLDKFRKQSAGTHSLKKFFSKQMEEVVKKRMQVSERLKTTTTLSVEEQSMHYSSWLYAAVHAAITISELDSKEKITSFLQIPMKKTNEILEFLIERGLVLNKEGRYKFGPSRVFSGNNSPNIIKHHTIGEIKRLKLSTEKPKMISITLLFLHCRKRIFKK